MKPFFSFGPGERLKKRSQFRNVYKNGRSVKSPNLKLVFLPTALSYNRVGFSVESRKVPLATKRVRIKRLLREAYRLNKPSLKKGFDMVFIAGIGAKSLDFKKAEKEAIELFRKSGVTAKQ